MFYYDIVAENDKLLEYEGVTWTQQKLLSPIIV